MYINVYIFIKHSNCKHAKAENMLHCQKRGKIFTEAINSFAKDLYGL